MKPNQSSSKQLGFEALRNFRESHSQTKIVHCHGVFDVLHAGHLAYFQSAKNFGDLLVVSLTSDEFVNKGPGRPYFNVAVRASMLASLEVIDYVVISQFPTAVAVIDALQPDFYVKGPDYRNKSSDTTGAIYLEESSVEKGGGKLVFTDDDTHSSSELINRFFAAWSDDQMAAIELIKASGGISVINEVLDLVSKESVCLVGEPIVDTYVFCQPEAISSKSPSISSKYLYQEDYAGGSLAIANHLADFVGHLKLITTHGDEPYFDELIKTKMDHRIEMIGYAVDRMPTPRKTRFISSDTKQRLFELTDLKADQWLTNDATPFSQLLLDHIQKNSTITILADFGHGLFEADVLETLQKVEGFIALNVQTNSSNFGFNPFTKHKHFSYLSIDTKEARLAYHDRFSAPMEITRRICSDYRYRNMSLSMTLGSAGSYFFPKGGTKEIYVPAFADSVVDATGAGDAFFALTSVLVKVGCPEIMIPFLGNVFAGLKTKIIGNKSSVTRAQLIKAASSILK